MRSFLAATGISVVAATSLMLAGTEQAGTEQGGYEVIANAFGFGVSIDGAEAASKNIREVTIDELNIDVRETTTGLDVEYRTFSPGAAHWGQARFTTACTRRASKELRLWWQEAAKGKNIRRNITVTLFKSNKTPGRSYRLIDARPVGFQDCDPSLPNDGATITVAPARIEFESAKEGTYPGKPPYDSWFRLEIQDANGRVNPDDTWEVLVGGAKSHEDPPLALGRIDPSDPSLVTTAHTTCTDLVLRGPMTDSRKALTGWINEVVVGKSWKKNLIVTNGKAAAVFADGFPIGYVFPRMSVTNVTGNTIEEVRLKFVRCELK